MPDLLIECSEEIKATETNKEKNNNENRSPHTSLKG